MRLINLILIITIGLASCKKDQPVPSVPSELKNGMLVLNEGLFQQNNSTISWVDLSSEIVDPDFFTSANGRLLGDTGNDMKSYGGKIYVVVNNSNTIEILNKSTGKSIKQISMMQNGIGKQPRSIAFYGSKAFITCYDGYVDVLDTTSLTIMQRIQVGHNPEGLAIASGKLFVANSGGLNYPNVDSTVSVIDLNDLTELNRITVGKNPGTVKVDADGEVYVIVRGNYGSIPSRMVRIDPVSMTLVESFAFDASGIEVMGNYFLISYFNHTTSNSEIKLFNTSSEVIENSAFIITTDINTLYGVQFNPISNKIYCFDAMNYTNTGYVLQYDANGVYEKKYHVGLNPSKIIFYE